MNSAYTQDLIHQRDRAAADRKAAEDELGKLRRHIAQLTEELKTAREALHLWVELGTKAIAEHRYAHAAHQSTIVEARRQAARADRAAENGNTETLKAYTQLRTERARAERAEARIAAVRELHQPVEFVESWTCAECSRTGRVAPGWPCSTIRALDGATSPADGRPIPAQPAHDCRIWEDDGEWNVSCHSCPTYVDNIGTENDAEQWAEEHKAFAEPYTAPRAPSCPNCLWPAHHGITCQQNLAILRSADKTP